MPLSLPQIPHVLTWAQTRGSKVKAQQLSASAMAWHLIVHLSYISLPFYGITKNLKRFNKISHMYNYSSEPHSRLSNFVTVFLEAGVKLINKRTGKKVVAWTKYSSDASIEY
jgi:hypothetical protein